LWQVKATLARFVVVNFFGRAWGEFGVWESCSILNHRRTGWSVTPRFTRTT